MVIAALFVVVKIWKQAKCFSMDEWLNKLWHIHIMDLYLFVIIITNY